MRTPSLLKPAEEQNPKIVQWLKEQPYYYRADNDDIKLGSYLRPASYITYSLRYAKSLHLKNIYLVTLPTEFVYAYTGNKWAKYHVITKTGDSKVIKKINPNSSEKVTNKILAIKEQINNMRRPSEEIRARFVCDFATDSNITMQELDALMRRFIAEHRDIIKSCEIKFVHK